MDKPLLPEKRDQQDLRPRYMPSSDVLRIVAGGIAVLGAVLGLLTRLGPLDRPNTVTVVTYAPPVTVTEIPAPVVSSSVYGMPNLAALRPATSLSRLTRRVCVDELRPKPRSGAWTCRGWDYLKFNEIGVQAVDPGGPCTHRLIIDGQQAWQCHTAIAIPKLPRTSSTLPWFFGDLEPANGIDHHKVAGLCYSETRASTHGQWRCGSMYGWRPLLPSYRGIQAVDPGGPCVEREVDQQTGVWYSMQAA